MKVIFDCTRADSTLLAEIVNRALPPDDKNGEERLNLHMDLTATHANGTPLRLAELLAAPNFDFWHDIRGIRRHIDRKTGKLGGCFVPRCAR